MSNVVNKAELIELLQDLVRINSVNPGLVPGGAGEMDMANYAAAYLRRQGLDARLIPVKPNRPNVIAVIEGARGGKSFLINAHLDTVSVEGMTDPFVPRLEDGKLYGRGALDTKGGLAAMLIAGKLLTQRRAELAGDVILTGVVDEEYESVGTEALVKEWKADAAVVLEPTGLGVVTAHKGFVWLEVETEGRAAHGSRPDLGIDAIVKMGDFLYELSGLEKALRKEPAHPKLGTGSLHASLISGGRELSSYPDRCVLQIERRTIPGERVDKVSSEVQRIMDRLQTKDPDFRARHRVLFHRDPYEISPSNPVLTSVGRAVERVTGRPAELIGLTVWADSALLGAGGTPAVVFGPGGEGLHGLVEYVVVDQVVACAEILVESVFEFFDGS